MRMVESEAKKFSWTIKASHVIIGRHPKIGCKNSIPLGAFVQQPIEVSMIEKIEVFSEILIAIAYTAKAMIMYMKLYM